MDLKIHFYAPVFLYEGKRVAYDGERSEPRNPFLRVLLLERFHSELRGHGFVVFLERHVFGYGQLRYDDARGVRGSVPRHRFQFHRYVYKPPVIPPDS
jgi:hypothetical protein